MSWLDLDIKLSDNTIKFLTENGFDKPTIIQKYAVPLILKHKDVAAEAVTGSGKTLAFLVPSVEIVLRNLNTSGSRVLILSPTNELAIQTFEILTKFLTYFTELGLKCQLISGINSHNGYCSKYDDMSNYLENKPQIVIATPGRLTDVFKLKLEKDGSYTEKKHTVLSNTVVRGIKNIDLLVLDEADRLLDLGFEEQLDFIFGICSRQRRTALFSATQTKKVEELFKAGLRNPVRLCVKESAIAKNSHLPQLLKLNYISLPREEKFAYLINFLRSHRNNKILIFLATCCCVTYFKKILTEHLKNTSDDTIRKYFLTKNQRANIFAVHGKLKKKRIDIFNKFKSSTCGIMLCTDVLARGIDVPSVNWVIQFDPPSNADSFVHRCGRTARFGKFGNALLMLSENEESYVNYLNISHNIQVEELDEAAMLEDKTGNRPDEPDLSPQECRKILQTMCQNDKLTYELSIKAYVSYVQFYRKHELNLIFQVKNIDFANLANSFGLLRMPRMPELKGVNVSAFQPPLKEVPIENIEYKDKDVRLNKLKDEQKPKKDFKKNKSWSVKREKEERRKVKRETMRSLGLIKEKDIVPIVLKGNKRPMDFDVNELDELANDYKELKKQKMSRKKRVKPTAQI